MAASSPHPEQSSPTRKRRPGIEKHRRVKRPEPEPLKTDPELYALCLVQAALRGGAREVRMERQGWVTRFELPGFEVGPSTMERLSECLEAPGPEGALARAVALASGLQPREIRLQSSGKLLRIRGELRAVLSQPCTDVVLEVDCRPAIVKRVLSRPVHREDRYLKNFCQLCPIPVSVGGTPLRGRFDLKGCLAVLLLGPVEGMPFYRPARAQVEARPAPGGDFVAALGLTGDEVSSKTMLVVDGLAFEGPRTRGLRAVVWTSALKLTEEMDGVVEDRRFQELTGQLKEALRELRNLLWERLPDMTPAQVTRASAYLETQLERARLSQIERLLQAREKIEGPNLALIVAAAERAVAENQLLDAKTYYQRAVQLAPERSVELLQGLVQVLQQLRIAPRQLEAHVQELVAAQGLGTRQARAAFFESMGRYSASQGYPREARVYLAEALTLQEGLLGRSHPTVNKLRDLLDAL